MMGPVSKGEWISLTFVLLIVFAFIAWRLFRKYRYILETREPDLRIFYDLGFTDAKMARHTHIPRWLIFLWRKKMRLPAHDRKEEARRDSWRPWVK